MRYSMLADGDASHIVMASAGLILLMLVGMIVAVRVKRRFQQDQGPISMDFSISDLRQLVKSGQMTPEEFEKAKAKVIERSQARLEQQAAEAQNRRK